MQVQNLQWQQTCCAWHGEMAETVLPSGVAVRVKRGPEIEGYLVMQFHADGQAFLSDEDGCPAYAEMTEAELQAVLQA